MKELTSFRSFKLPPTPQLVEYGIYAIVIILIIVILKKSKKTDESKGYVIPIYKSLIMGLFGNFLLGIIYSSSFALYFIISAPKYEAKVIGSITRLEYMEGKINLKGEVQYPILELKDNYGKIIKKESNEGILGKPIIGEQATIAYQNGKLITVTIFSVFTYAIVLLISLFVMCVLLYWTVFAF